MREIDNSEIEDILDKYKHKLNNEMDIPEEQAVRVKYSQEYTEFKRELTPKHMSLYEQMCNYCAKLFTFKLDPKKEQEMAENIRISHLDITPSGAYSFSFLFPIMFIFLGLMLLFVLKSSIFFMLVVLVFGLILIQPLGKIPEFYANSWRMKASNQMVLCIFYVVTFMRHTSNLEGALRFAADHLGPPLGLDLKKVLWDVETEKYESVKESLDSYLETWRNYNMELIEAFHLIEASLYEGAEDRRLNSLDKSLDVILTETYEKMLHYAHNLKSPITMLNMMGVILPILGLVMLPLIVSFMDQVQWYHIATLYNVFLPIIVFYMGKNILAKRPTGYGDTDISEQNPELKRYRNTIIKIGSYELAINPLYFSIIIGVTCLFLGLLPVILHTVNPEFDVDIFEGYKLLDYRASQTLENEDGTPKIVGPYGLGASILSLAIPLSIALAFGIYYRIRSKNLMKIRENSKKLENEFASALFQLGNRLGDGLPAEIAFDKVANVMEGTVSGSFFSVASTNIKKLGVGVKEAIFHPQIGALVRFPSNLIESSMKVLVESIRKGPQIAAQALINISRYVKEIHQVNERLKDLMADIISSMKSQTSFLTPVISGIVVGITSMITAILGKLGSLLPGVAGSGGSEASAMGAAGQLAGMFGDGIPTYYFQFVVGIYVIEIISILTILTNGIENGSDKLNERNELGNNLIRGAMLYTIISAIVIILFNLIAGMIMNRSMPV